MYKELVNFYNSCEEMELEGYCECVVSENHDDNTFDNYTPKIYIFYINTNIGRHEIVLSIDLDLCFVVKYYKYMAPEDILKDYKSFEILNIKYFAINDFDYLDRKLFSKMEDDERIVFLLYDFVFLVNKKKLLDNVDFFIKKNRSVSPIDEEKFIDSVLCSKRATAKPNSLEEKIYHYEDVSTKEREIFYKGKKVTFNDETKGKMFR